MAGPGVGDLATRIRLGLASGKTRDEIVADLVRGGLSGSSAERFVDRALAARDAGAPAREPPSEAETKEDPSGRRAMISGAFWLALGSCVTGVTYLLAKPGGKYVLAYGAVLAGALAFARGLSRWRQTATGPFPWRSVLVAAGVPVLGTFVLIGGAAGMRTYRRATQAAERERQERAERARQEDEAAAARRGAADQARGEAQAKRVRRAWETVRTSEHPTILCDAALLLGRNGLREAVPDLEVLLRNPRYTSVRACAAAALLDLGEIDTVLPAYVEWAGGADSDLSRMALGGFGDVGPRAAPMALPFLAEALRSPYWDRRYVAVDALSKLGPTARPLLEEARNDPHQEVREHAARALAGGEGR